MNVEHRMKKQIKNTGCFLFDQTGAPRPAAGLTTDIECLRSILLLLMGIFHAYDADRPHLAPIEPAVLLDGQGIVGGLEDEPIGTV